MRSLAERLGEFCGGSGDAVTLVLDSRPLDDMPQAPGLEVVFATPRRGTDAGDDEIARIVAEHAEPETLSVVTADRELVDRVARHMAGGEFEQG